MSRLCIFSLTAICFVAIGISSGCAHPYSGSPETLSKPRRRPPPEDAVRTEDSATNDGPISAGSSTPCRTNFFAEPPKRLRRRPSDARKLARDADEMLLEAEAATGPRRLSSVVAAIDKLNSALAKDPYSPEATYKLGVAYALAGRKPCTLALLERLNLLRGYADTEREAERVVQRAVREPAFGTFRQDANTALGE